MSFLPKSGLAVGILGGVVTGIKWLIHFATDSFKRFYEILNRGNN